MEPYNVFIGDYIISNQIISLYLSMSFTNLEILFEVKLPNNYPLTKLGETLKYNEDDSDQEEGVNYNILYATFSIKNKQSSGWNAFLDENHIFMKNTNHQIILREFFSTESIPLTDEEKYMIKGLGKKVLCLGMPYIIDFYNINPLTTPISLTSRIPLKLRQYYTDKYGFVEQRPSYDRGIIGGYVMATMLSTFMEHC